MTADEYVLSLFAAERDAIDEIPQPEWTVEQLRGEQQ